MNHPLILAAAAVRSRPLHAKAESVEIRAAAADGAALPCPTFDVLAYTGGQLLVDAYELPIVIDLAGLDVAPIVAANRDHVADRAVGQADPSGVTNDGRQLRIKGLLNAPTAWRDEIVAGAKDAYQWGASIENRPSEGALEMVKPGQTATANGRTFQGPVIIARKSTLFGLAFLFKGTEADRSTVVTIAAASAAPKEKVMDFATWLTEQGFDAAQQAALNDKQKAFLQATYDAAMASVAAAAADAANANPGAAANPAAAAAATANAVAASAKFDIDGLKAAYAGHESEIEKAIFAAAGKVDAVKCAEIKASALRSAVDLKSTAIQKEWSPLQFQVEALRLQNKMNIDLLHAERPTGPAIHASAKEIGNDVIEAALAQRLRMPGIEKRYSDKTLQTAHTEWKGRFGLQQALIMAAAANGMQLRLGDRVHAGNLRDILFYALPPRTIHASGFSTIDLSGILSGITQKELLQGYESDDSAWREAAEISSASTFHQMTRYRMLDNFEYEELSKTGHIVHGTVGEESWTTQLKTYAKMFVVPREDIINDSLQAFQDVRKRLVQGGRRKFRGVFWAKFLDNSTFYTSGRGNYITGSTTNLGTDGVGLQLMINAASTIKSSSADGSRRMGFTITKLFVPPELQGNAEKLYVGQNLNVGSGPGEPNIHMNKYRPVPVPELSDSAFTGYSSTAFYGSGDMLKPMCVTFLDGQETPTVEAAEADFDQLGIATKGYHDFGCDAAEYIETIKSKGSA